MQLLQQGRITASTRNESCETILPKDDFEKLTEFHLKTQLKELTHLVSTLLTTCMSCKENEKIIGYFITESSSKNEIFNNLSGNFFFQNIGKQNLRPSFF